MPQKAKNTLSVLLVSTTDSSGGAARAAYRLHKGIQKLGAFSQLFVKTKSKNDSSIISVSEFEPQWLLYKAYNFFQTKVKNKIQKFWWRKYPNKAGVFMSDLRSISVHGALQKLEYDVLHLNWFNLRFLDIKELLTIRKPIIWTLHDTWAFTGICHYHGECNNYQNTCGQCPLLKSDSNNDLSHNIFMKKLDVYKRVQLHIVTPSEWLANEVKNSSLLNQFPVTVIPNGLDTAIYAPTNKQKACEILGLGSFSKKILFGAFNSTKDTRKGFDKLISALTYLEQQADSNLLELIIFGASEPIYEIETSIPISYLGYISDEYKMALIYNSSDVMVVPSIEEVFGQTASEAMSCGVPVVAFNCTGIREVVNHKESGYLARPYCPEDLAKGIIWCLQHNFYGELSANARKKTLEYYSIEKVSQQYLSLYNALIE